MATDASALADVTAAAAATPPRVPGAGARVHKDESCYSFATPFTPGGLYVNLTTWQVCVCVERERGCGMGR